MDIKISSLKEGWVLETRIDGHMMITCLGGEILYYEACPNGEDLVGVMADREKQCDKEVWDIIELDAERKSKFSKAFAIEADRLRERTRKYDEIAEEFFKKTSL